MIRIAFMQNGQLVALFFAAAQPVRLSRASAISLIGEEIPAQTSLAGRAAAGAVDPGPTVCACFNVGRSTLIREIEAGAETVADLGTRTCAGTNCGSCKPELARLLTEAAVPLAAE